MMEVPFFSLFGGSWCVMMNWELGAWNLTDDIPFSYMIGLLEALLVRGGEPPRKKESIAYTDCVEEEIPEYRKLVHWKVDKELTASSKAHDTCCRRRRLKYSMITKRVGTWTKLW